MCHGAAINNGALTGNCFAQSAAGGQRLSIRHRERRQLLVKSSQSVTQPVAARWSLLDSTSMMGHGAVHPFVRLLLASAVVFASVQHCLAGTPLYLAFLPATSRLGFRSGVCIVCLSVYPNISKLW